MTSGMFGLGRTGKRRSFRGIIGIIWVVHVNISCVIVVHSYDNHVMPTEFLSLHVVLHMDNDRANCSGPVQLGSPLTHVGQSNSRSVVVVPSWPTKFFAPAKTSLAAMSLIWS